MPFVTKKMNIKNAWVFVKPSELKRYPYFTPMGTLLCRLHLWAQSSINQAKHEIMLTCVIAFVRPLLGSSTAVKESPAMLRVVPYRTKNLGCEQYPQNGNLLICSTLEVGELTSQYISSIRIVTKIKKNPWRFECVLYIYKPKSGRKIWFFCQSRLLISVIFNMYIPPASQFSRRQTCRCWRFSNFSRVNLLLLGVPRGTARKKSRRVVAAAVVVQDLSTDLKGG